MSEGVHVKVKEITSVQDLIKGLKWDKNYREAIKYGSNNYNVTQYKINKVKLEEIPELINLIELNYINVEKGDDQNADKRKCTWLANELKLFVWMAVCHSYLIKKPLEQYVNLGLKQNEDDWEFFINVFTRKTSADLEFQSKSLFKNYHGNKEKWDSEQEDLLKLIIESNKKYYRSSQKCREYWFNHLDPLLNKNPWTIDEDLKLVKEVQTYGYKWSKLTQVIESTWGYRRTQHMVKNRTKLLSKKFGFKDDKEQSSMKELQRIEKKLMEEKLKSSNSTSYIKQQEELDSKSYVNQSQSRQIKNTPHSSQNAKISQKSERCKKQELLQRQKKWHQFDSESSSSQQDFDNQDRKKKQRKGVQNPQKDDKLTNKRNVIILYHANSKDQQKQLPHRQQGDNISDEQSPEIMIAEHIEQPNLNEEAAEEQNQEESEYFDEYKIIEEVPQVPKIDLNQQIQFEHHTHGGTMRERVTHELAKFFPTPQNQIISG